MVHYSEKKDLFPLAGGCCCGLTRFQLTEPPILVHCCHCTSCQRQTGSAFALNAVIESTALVTLPAAAPTISPSHSNPTPLPAGLLPVFARNTGATPEAPPADAKPELICIPSESGVGQTIARCPACHTALWNYYADGGPHIAYVRVGTLDRAWEIDPDVHIFTSSRRAFVAVDDGKPQFEKYYTSREALIGEYARERLARLGPLKESWIAEIKAAM
jgi:hypothetical protein